MQAPEADERLNACLPIRPACVKISANYSIIDKNRFDLSDALPCKAENTSLSRKTMAKLAHITNRDYGFGLGGAFTTNKALSLPKGRALVQLKLEALRNDLTVQRLRLREGSCLKRYLGEVLKRLPQPPAQFRPHPQLQPHVQADRMTADQQKPSHRNVTFGVETVEVFHDHPGEVRTSYKGKSSAAQLRQFLKDGLELGYSDGERARFWDAAMNVAHLKPFAQALVTESAVRACEEGWKDLLPSLETLVELIDTHGGVDRLRTRAD